MKSDRVARPVGNLRSCIRRLHLFPHSCRQRPFIGAYLDICQRRFAGPALDHATFHHAAFTIFASIPGVMVFASTGTGVSFRVGLYAVVILEM